MRILSWIYSRFLLFLNRMEILNITLLILFLHVFNFDLVGARKELDEVFVVLVFVKWVFIYIIILLLKGLIHLLFLLQLSLRLLASSVNHHPTTNTAFSITQYRASLNRWYQMMLIVLFSWYLLFQKQWFIVRWQWWLCRQRRILRLGLVDVIFLGFTTVVDPPDGLVTRTTGLFAEVEELFIFGSKLSF